MTGRAHVQHGRRVLHDEEAERALSEEGFAVVPFLDATKVAAVADAAGNLGPAPDDPRGGLFFGVHSRSQAYKEAVRDAIVGIVGVGVDRTFVDYRVYLAMFITKWPGRQGALQPHQDTTTVDETRFRGINLWCPVGGAGVERGVDDGSLRLVPGTHLLRESIRYAGQPNDQVAHLTSSALTPHSTSPRLRPGEAIVFDHRIVHFSPPNYTTDPRLVVSLGLCPSEADTLTIRPTSEGDAAVFVTTADFYYRDHLATPQTGPIHRVNPPVDRRIAIEELGSFR